MPEEEGYAGIINLLGRAVPLMEDGKAKDLVMLALQETVKQAKQSLNSLEIGMELGRILKEAEDLQ